MVPVLVFAKAGSPHVIGLAECFPVEDGWKTEPIGYLRGFEAAELVDDKMVEAELASNGLTMKYAARRVKAANGCVAVLVCFAVEVPNYEAANKLPGFVPFGEWAGPVFWVPPEIANVAGEGGVLRLPVSDFYNEFEPPPYDENAVFISSLVQYGYLAEVIFLRDDPLHLYVIRNGSMLMRAEKIAAAQQVRTAAS